MLKPTSPLAPVRKAKEGRATLVWPSRKLEALTPAGRDAGLSAWMREAKRELHDLTC